jgi:hypothetical protein
MNVARNLSALILVAVCVLAAGCGTGPINISDKTLPTIVLNGTGWGIQNGKPISGFTTNYGAQSQRIIDANPGTGTFDLIATGVCPSGVQSVTVNVTNGTVTSGERTSYSVANQSSSNSTVTVPVTLQPLTSNGDQIVTVSATVADFNNHTYTTAPVSIVCDTQPPTTATLNISPQTVNIPLGQGPPSVTLSWQVIPTDADVAITSSPLANGGFGPNLPAIGQEGFQFTQTTVLTLTATTSGGHRTIQNSVFVTRQVPPPVINSFTVTPAGTDAQGRSLFRLSWSVTNASHVSIDPYGNLPADTPFDGVPNQASSQPAAPPKKGLLYAAPLGLAGPTLLTITLTAYDLNGVAGAFEGVERAIQ